MAGRCETCARSVRQGGGLRHMTRVGEEAAKVVLLAGEALWMGVCRS